MPDISAHESWKSERLAAVTAPAGNLALVEFVPVEGDAESYTVEGLRAARTDDREGVIITPPPGATAAVDGVPMTGPTFVGRLTPDGTPLVTVDRFTIDVFSLDGSDYELRVYDPEAERRAAFQGIEVYPYDESAVVSGRFRAFAENESVPWEFTRESDTGHTKQVPGVVEVSVDGAGYELAAFLNGPTMVLVYADGTTGAESYAPGKFLVVPAPAEDGSVTLDFNYSFIPPCGFSYSYSCPVPPAQNKIAAPLRAGEKVVRYAE